MLTLLLVLPYRSKPRITLSAKYLCSSSVYRDRRGCGMFGSLVAEPKAKAMRMNFGEVLEIKDLGKHPAVAVIRLGILLAGTVSVTPDPKRKNFYEVEGVSTVYYIYVSPISGTVSLIATWKTMAQPMPQLDVAVAVHS
jgi:hypothetical protein